VRCGDAASRQIVLTTRCRWWACSGCNFVVFSISSARAPAELTVAMAFANPFAGDPDFQFLALDRKKLMEEAPPYDAKTSCWVPDQREGFMRANIQATKGDEITVLTEKGEVRVRTLGVIAYVLSLAPYKLSRWIP